MHWVTQGELRRAERFLKLALDEAKQGFGLDDPHVAAATQNLAELYRVSRQYDLAGPLYEKVSIMYTWLGSHRASVPPAGIRMSDAVTCRLWQA
jgi:hypothetical protein